MVEPTHLKTMQTIKIGFIFPEGFGVKIKKIESTT